MEEDFTYKWCVDSYSKQEIKKSEKYLDVLDNELDRIHVLLLYDSYEKNGGDYDELVRIMKRFQIEILRVGKTAKNST